MGGGFQLVDPKAEAKTLMQYKMVYCEWGKTGRWWWRVISGSGEAWRPETVLLVVIWESQGTTNVAEKHRGSKQGRQRTSRHGQITWKHKNHSKAEITTTIAGGIIWHLSVRQTRFYSGVAIGGMRCRCAHLQLLEQVRHAWGENQKIRNWEIIGTIKEVIIKIQW